MLHGEPQPQCEIGRRLPFSRDGKQRLHALQGNILCIALPAGFQMVGDLPHLAAVYDAVKIRRKQRPRFRTFHDRPATSEGLFTEAVLSPVSEWSPNSGPTSRT